MKATKAVVNIFVFISVAAIVAMLGITVGDVIGRMIFTHPIVGATEMCEILMSVVLTAVGGSLIAGKTVQVDVLMDALPRKVSIKVDYGVLVISALYCFLAGWATIREGQYSMSTFRTYKFLKVAKAPFQFLLAFSFIVAGIAAIMFIVTLRQSKSDGSAKSIMDHSDLAILKGDDDE